MRLTDSGFQDKYALNIHPAQLGREREREEKKKHASNLSQSELCKIRLIKAIYRLRLAFILAGCFALRCILCRASFEQLGFTLNRLLQTKQAFWVVVCPHLIATRCANLALPDHPSKRKKKKTFQSCAWGNGAPPPIPRCFETHPRSH